MRATYPTYKSTSIPWLPEMPEHWEQRKNKYLFRRSKSLVGKDFEKYPVLSLTMHGVIRRDLDNPMGKMPATFADYQLIQDNTLLFCLFDYDVTPRTVGMVNEKGIVSPAYTSMYPIEKIDLKYYYYWFLMLDERKMLLTHVTNLRNSVSYETFAGLFSPFPPLPEQTAIANYLDAKTEQINRFIEKKEKLIRNLREKIDVIVQSIESEPLNESKFWPTIPQTWRIEKAKRIFSEIKIKNQPTEPLLAATQDRGVLPKDLCMENFVSPSGDLLGLKLVCEDDYVISLRSFQGGIEYSPYRGIISPAYTIIRLKEDYNNPLLIQYYKYLFKTPQFISLLNTAITGIRDGKNVNWVDFAELPLPIPSVEHLKLMVEDFNRYERLVIVFEKEKRKLEEFKNSLIAEVVTGKIKVA
ncbi:MAG: restriction endonuclease subunit S [Bacteroidia bacterium]